MSLCGNSFKLTRSAVHGVLVALVFLIPWQTAHAHTQDMFLQEHTIHLGPEGLTITWAITPGSLLAGFVWQDVDSDGSTVVDSDEAYAWIQTLLQDYFVLLDESLRLSLRLETVEWPATLVDLQSGTAIQVQLAATWPGDQTSNLALTLYNGFEEEASINWFYLYGDDGITFSLPVQQGGTLSTGVSFAQVGTEGGTQSYWDSGTPTLVSSLASGERPATVSPTLSRDQESATTLIDLIRETDLSLSFTLVAVIIALGLGAIHALTPGHGKALVGAYLVGARGTTRHAVALGSIVTLTHTGSVLIIGVITLAASHYLVPTTLFPILELASGLLITAMGLSLIRRRWRGLRGVQAARRQKAQPMDVPAATQGSSGAGVVRIAINQPVAVNVYDNVLPNTSLSLRSLRWRALVALGVSGGMVPCPDAIAILLVAVAINRLGLGLLLIVAFSLGLALVLTVVGIVMVRSQRLFEGWTLFDRVMPAMPLVSTVIVIGLGMVLSYKAVAGSDWFGTTSAGTAPPIADLSALVDQDELQQIEIEYGQPFDIDRAGILYFEEGEHNQYQIIAQAIADSTTISLTANPNGIWDFTLTSDGQRILYTAGTSGYGTTIQIMNLDGSDVRTLVTCDVEVCGRPVLSPDGELLVFAKLDMASLSGVYTLWRYDFRTGEAAPLFQDAQLPSSNPAFSPDGQWLSYLIAPKQQAHLYNLQDGRHHAIPSNTGTRVMWNPDGRSVLVTHYREQDLAVHLLHYTLDTETLTDLTGDTAFSDQWPSWSPDGEWIAFVRDRPVGSSLARDNQIWIMRADGSEVRQVTNTPDVLHMQPFWSPDTRYLLFQRVASQNNSDLSGLCILDLETGQLQVVADLVYSPTWLPDASILSMGW